MITVSNTIIFNWPKQFSLDKGVLLKPINWIRIGFVAGRECISISEFSLYVYNRSIIVAHKIFMHVVKFNLSRYQHVELDYNTITQIVVKTKW